MLRTHHVVRTAIGLARNQRQLRHRCFAIRVEQLGAMANDAAPLLLGTRQEARHVNEGENRNAEGVAGAHKARGLLARGDVEHARELARLVADNANRVSIETREAHHDIAGVRRLDLEERAIVDDRANHGVHVVRLVRTIGDQRVEFGAETISRIVRRRPRRSVNIVLRQERNQRTRIRDTRGLVLTDEVADTALLGMRIRTTELFHRDLFARHRPHHIGAGDEHVRGLADHQNEVGNRGRVDRATRAGSHDQRDLRDHTRGVDVALKDVGIAAKRNDALLDARATRIVDADKRTAIAQRQIHHLADLLGENLTKRAAENREVLREREDATTVDQAMTRDDTVAIRTAIGQLGIAMLGITIDLAKRAGVEQRLDALTRQALTASALALLGLRIDVLRLHAQFLKMGDALCCRAGIVAISHGVIAFLPGTARE